jgi:hypothetical protein
MLSATRVGLALGSAAAVTAAGLLAPVAADAQTYYANCTALHRDFTHGVAKSYRAARRERRRTGYPMAAYGRHARKVYWANQSRLDADNDGVACEA